jgi:ABC-type multidrug transport system fused ATPase/permease subunit
MKTSPSTDTTTFSIESPMKPSENIFSNNDLVKSDKSSSNSNAPTAAATPPPVPLLKLFRFATPFDILCLVIGCIFAGLAGASQPLFTIFFGKLLNGLNSNQDLIIVVNELCFQLGMLGIATFICTWISVSLPAWAAARQVSRLRAAYMRALLRQDAAWHDNGRAGEAATRMAADTVAFQGAVGQDFSAVVRSAVMFFSGIIIAFVQGWKLALVVLGFIPIFAIVGAVVHKNLGVDSNVDGQAYARAGAIATEAFAALRTVAAFGGERAELRRYDAALADSERASIKAGNTGGFAVGVLFLTMFSCYAVGLYWGARLVLMSRDQDPLCAFDPNRAGCFTGGMVLNVVFALLMGGGALGQAGPALGVISKATGSAVAIFNTIDRVSPIDPDNDKGIRPLPSSIRGEIEFRDVTFAYPSRPDSPVLRNFSLLIRAGENIALVGSSGSGKSTIIQLIQRQYDPQSGSVLLDGVDLREYNVQALRSLQALVSQEPQLFAASIRDNIALGRSGHGSEKPTDADVESAARVANVSKFVAALPRGLDTMVTTAQLSGGQKQRVAIARALVRAPRCLLLDEATSALDSTSERAVQRDIDRLLEGRKKGPSEGSIGGCTAVVIAHRLSTITRADIIVVLDAGRIVESGSHAVLMGKEDSVYKKLRELQRVQDDAVDINDDNDEEEVPSSPKTPANDIAVTSAADIAAARAGNAADEIAAAKEEEAALAAIPAVSDWRLFEYNWKHDKVWLFIGLLSCLVMGSTFPAFSYLLSQFMSVYYEPDSDKLLRTVTLYMAIFFGLGGAGLIGGWVQKFSFEVLRARMLHRIRFDLFKAAISKPIGFHDLKINAVGRLTSRLAAESELLASTMGTPMAVGLQNIFQFLVGLGIAFWSGWRMTLVVLACAPLLAIGGIAEIRYFLKSSQDALKQFDENGEIASEAMTLSRTVAAFGLQKHIGVRFDLALERPTASAKKAAVGAGVGFAFGQAMIVIIYAIAFRAGAEFINAGQMTFGELMTSFFAVVFAAMGLGQASAFSGDIAKMTAAKKGIFAIIDSVSSIDPLSGCGDPAVEVINVASSSVAVAQAQAISVPNTPSNEVVRFTDVHFCYPARPQEPVLRGLTFSIQRGKTIAIVGPSGSGKSTIVQLLLRFYDANSGSVSVDGKDVRSYHVASLRKRYGWVQQEAPLFADSIAYNIAYGSSDDSKRIKSDQGVQPDSKPDEVAAIVKRFSPPPFVIQAAEDANALGFVDNFAHGFATFAGERGSQLSGGQKQRIAIARAISRSPEILLLDEATSALDSESEAIVQASIDKLLEEARTANFGSSPRTTIVIAHRLSTIRRCDEILVIDGGRVAERGTHAELMLADGSNGTGIYKQMVLVQDAGLGAKRNSSSVALASSE